jgi:hypothetical protein
VKICLWQIFKAIRTADCTEAYPLLIVFSTYFNDECHFFWFSAGLWSINLFMKQINEANTMSEFEEVMVLSNDGVLTDFLVGSKKKGNYTWGPEFFVMVKNPFDIESLVREFEEE